MPPWGGFWGLPWGAGGPFFEVDNFQVRRGDEGPQIIGTWTLKQVPFAQRASEVRVVRKRGEFPQNVNDGKTIITDTSPLSVVSFVDLLVDPLVGWYYAVFEKDVTGVFVQDVTKRGVTFTYDTGFFQRKMFDLLPEDYRVKDAQSRQVALKQAADSTSDGEIRNLGEDGSVNRGELERFLRIFGLFNDDIKGLIDFYQNLFDVDETIPPFLGRMASLVGIVPNFDIPISKQREEIKTAVLSFRDRGTIGSIESAGLSITGLTTIVDEFGDNVLVSNDENKVSVQIDKPEITSLFGQPGDVTQFSLDFTAAGFYAFDKIGVFLIIDKDTEGLTTATLNKLLRKLKDLIPAGIIEKVIILDKAGGDTYALATSVDESSSDVITP